MGGRNFLVLVAVSATIVELGLASALVEPRRPAAGLVLVVGLAVSGIALWRTLRVYRFTRRRVDLLVVVGIVLLAAAYPMTLLDGLGEVGTWPGYTLGVVALALVGSAFAHDVRRGVRRSRQVLGDATGANIVVEAEASLGSHMRALLAELAERESHMEGHARRVALRAAQVGDALGLSPGRVRDLAIGGLLHDIGKLTVPRAILGKPGQLTEAEYQVVMQHVLWGPALLRDVGRLSPTVHRLVRGHHERFDGSGYPRAVAGDPIPLDVAILAVCDVYDALISERVYRPAWSHERALDHLRAGAGKQFDATCVETLADVLASERRADLAVAV